MFQNQFKLALRSLLKSKTFSGINLAGLAVGMAVCLTILGFVKHEMSFDRFHKNADRIVRVCFRGTVQGERMNESNVMPPVAATLKADFPEIEDATRLRNLGSQQIETNEQTFRGQKLGFVDANFGSVFTMPFVAGDPKTAFVEPNSVVLSESASARFFGKNNPLGQSLKLNGQPVAFKITGVMVDIPENSSFHFDLLGSMASLPEANLPDWMQSNFYTFLLLKKGISTKNLEAKLPAVVDKYIGPQMQQAMGLTLAQFREKGNSLVFYFQPLTDIYLHSDFQNDLSKHGDIRYVWIFSAVAAFMLLIACINFMNLSTASSSKRAKEIGIRKVAGSTRGELMRQFLLESGLMSLLALALALGLVETALPFFNRLTGIPISLNLLENVWILPGLLAFGIGTGILAGSYPAFFLSGFKPNAVLKGSNSVGKMGGARFRNGLVVGQFFLTGILLICTLTVFQQLRFMENTPLGFQKEAVLVLPDLGFLGSKKEVFLEKIRQEPRVLSFSQSGYLPAGESFGNNFFLENDLADHSMVKTLRYDIDPNYLPTLGIQLAAGRNFEANSTADSTKIIVNETAARAFGWPENPLGQTVKHALRGESGADKIYQVIGVVKDFHFRSLHERISPLVMVLEKSGGSLILKTQTTDAQALLASLKKDWSGLTDEPFSVSFLDERVQNGLQVEQKFGTILGLFAGLAIFVACLGLFGLTIFVAERRTKEIGIRKVLGASVGSVVGLLAKDFLKLVVVAIVIASPVAWFFMKKWLSDFAYRIEISWWMFAAAGAGAVAIAFLTVGFQSVKAALANPVKSLRSE